MDRPGMAHVWRALSVVAVVAVCLILAVVVVQAAHLWRPGLPNALK